MQPYTVKSAGIARNGLARSSGIATYEILTQHKRIQRRRETFVDMEPDDTAGTVVSTDCGGPTPSADIGQHVGSARRD